MFCRFFGFCEAKSAPFLQPKKGFFMTELFPESEDDFLSTKKATELFPESEDEEDNAVCTDIASRDEVVSPTPQAEELANSMFDFQSTLTTFVDSTVAGEKLLENKIHRMEVRLTDIQTKLENQLQMIKEIDPDIVFQRTTNSRLNDIDKKLKDVEENIEGDWLQQEVEDSIKTDWLQEEVERLVWKNCEKAKEDIKDETRDFVAEETKNDNKDKFNEMFEKLDEQFRKINEKLAKVVKE